MLRCTLAYQHFEAGQWEDALAELEPAVGSDQGAGSSLAHGLIALIAGYQDDGGVAEEHLAAVSEQGGRAAAAASNSHYLHLARAVAAERAGRPDAAVAVLAACLAPGAAMRMPARHLLLPALVRLALAVGDADTAAAAAQAAGDEAEREPLPVKGAVADHCRGLLTAIYRGMEAQWAIRSASARVRDYGIRPRQHGYRARPAHGWESLTPPEAKIARLIAAGRSNPEIAAELFLSRSTVRAHVSRILVKFGARSRTEIASAAGERERPAP